MPVVRELLSREDVQGAEAAGDGLALATGATTVELLDAFRRLIDLLSASREIAFFEGMIKREIIYRILQGPLAARLRAIASTGDQSQRTAKAIAWIRTNYTKPERVDELAAVAGMAYEVGYESASQFTREYSRLFGRSPMRDVEMLRLGGGQVVGVQAGTAGVKRIGL